MAKMTRRAALMATSAGIATLTGVGAVLSQSQHPQKAHAAAAAPSTATGATTTGSLTVFVKDVTKGEVSLMMGEREVVVQNPALVRQLLALAQH